MAVARADLADDMQEVTLPEYRTAIHNQHRWTNRALDNRCRPLVSLEDFTKRPLKDVGLQWRGRHIDRAKYKHHKAQHRSSLCVSAGLMDWYYASGAKCVHEHEGAWNSNTGNGYYGGFQADISFQTSYNPGAYLTYGTADRWPPIEQIEMAHAGWVARGWYPWPNTAAMCGLL